MKNTKLENKIMKKISSEKIKPIDKKHFVIINLIVMFFASLSLVSSIIGITINLVYLARIDVDLLRILSLKTIIQLLFPLLIWIGIGILSGAGIQYFLKLSDHGYKIEIKYLWAIILVIASIISPIIILNDQNSFGLHKQNLVMRFSDPRYVIWNNPNQGFLAGKLILVNKHNIIVEDLSGEKWEVNYSEAYISRKAKLTVNNTVKILGEQTGKNSFNAKRITPWGVNARK